MSKVEHWASGDRYRPALRRSQELALELLRVYRGYPTPEGRVLLMVAAGLLREVTHAAKRFPRLPSIIMQVDSEGRFVRSSIRF